MDAIRQLVWVQGRTATIRLPDHFHVMRVEVIVLNADEVLAASAPQLPNRRRPSPLLAGTRITGDIRSPVVEDDDWDALK